MPVKKNKPAASKKKAAVKTATKKAPAKKTTVKKASPEKSSPVKVEKKEKNTVAKKKVPATSATKTTQTKASPKKVATKKKAPVKKKASPTKPPAAASKAASKKKVTSSTKRPATNKKTTTTKKSIKKPVTSTTSTPPAPLEFKPYVATRTEDYMNDEQKTHFRGLLNEWKSELMQEVDRTVSHMKDEASNFPDPADRASQEEEFSLELRTRDRERKLIKKIDTTLELIEIDDYGYCETCGVEIGVRRLEARPTATLCIDCKTLDEIKERQEHG